MPQRTRAALVCAVILCTLLIPVAVAAEDTPIELTGTVRYPDGTPAAGVTLHLGKEAVTDANGCYRVTVGRETLESRGVDAEHGDYVLSECCLDVSDSDCRNQPVVRDFTLVFACLVLGEVVDDATSRPIADADVLVLGQYGGETKSNADGAFKMRVAPVADLSLTVEKKGYVTSRANFSAEGLNSTAFRIRLKTGGVVRGLVTDKSGAPISGVAVQVREEQIHGKDARTDADGRYEIRDVRTDRPSGVSVSFGNYHYTSNKLVEFPAGKKEAVVDFVLDRIEPRAIAIEGTVVDSSGKPVAGAEVRFGTSTCAGNKRETKTAADGSYKLTDVSPEKDLILVQAKGFAPEFLPVEENTRRADAKLQAPHFAEITVVDKNRKPLAGVHVAVNADTPVLGRLYDTPNVIGSSVYGWLSDNIATDVNGKARLEDLPAHGVVLYVYKKDYAAPMNIPIRVDRKDNVIVMRGTPQFAGTVVDAATRKPLRGFKVKWGGAYSETSVFDSPDGRFKVQLDGPPGGKKYDVKVWAQGYLSEEKKLTITETPKADYSATFALTRPFPITGRVTDATGKGIAGAKLSVIETSGNVEYNEVPSKVSDLAYQLTAITGPDGRFSIPQARERTAMVMIEKEGFSKFVREGVDLTKPLNLTLALPASVEIKALGIAAGEEPSVDISGYGSSRMTEVTGELPKSGIGHYAGFEPGRYSIQVSNRRYRSVRMVTLTAGSKATVDLDAKGQVLVRGVVARGGAPVEGISVNVNRNRYESDACETDRDGVFEIEIEKPGKTRIWCHGTGMAVLWDRREVELKAGENVVNFDLPNGRVSGRVVNAQTGEPMVGEAVVAQAKPGAPKARYTNAEYDRFWVGQEMATAVTTEDGSFTLSGVPGGEVVLEVARPREDPRCVLKLPKVDESKPLGNVVMEVSEKGSLAVEVVDADTGKSITSGWRAIATPEGALMYDRREWGLPSSVPAGSYLVWVDPLDGRHMPASAKVEIKPRQTAKVRVKLPAVEQRIVFAVPKDGRFSKLEWLPPSNDDSAEMPKSAAWIGYTLKYADTGKPVRTGPLGDDWTGILRRDKPAGELAIPVQPGKYILDAVLRDTYDAKIESKSNLWHIKKTITVEKGRDEVIQVR